MSKLKVTLIKSASGRLKKHKACLVGLGLRKIHQSVVLDNTASILGMINKVNYLVSCEEV